MPLKSAKPKKTLRTQMVYWLEWGVAHKTQFTYSESRPIPVGLPAGTSQHIVTDCSGFVTLCAKWAGAPDPNGQGYSGQGYTGTLLTHCQAITEAQAEPGDLIVYGPYPGHHVVGIVEKLSRGDFQTASHGRQGDPRFVTYSLESRFQPAPAHFLRFLPA